MIADEVDVEFEALQQLPVNKLHERFESVYGETPRSRNKVWLIRKILWRLQSLNDGGLSERARLRAAELAVDADVRLMPAKRPNAKKAKSLEEPRRSPEPTSHDERLPLTPKERRAKRTSPARSMKAGSACRPCMMTADSQAAMWNVQDCSGC